MALPLSPNTVYAPDDPVKSADLNDIQSQIVGLFGGKHGEQVLWLPAASAQALGATSAWRFNGQPLAAGSETFGGWESDNGVAVKLDLPIPLFAGRRLKQLDLHILEDASAGRVQATVLEIDPTGDSPVTKGPQKLSGSSSAYAVLTWDSSDADFPLTLASDRMYTVRIELDPTGSIGDVAFRAARLVFDKV